MVAGFWTLDLTTITGQSAFILRHHTAAVSSYDCRFDDLELVHQSLRTLAPPHTHKFPRVNAQDSKLGPIQPWDVKDFLRPGPRASGIERDLPSLVIAPDNEQFLFRRGVPPGRIIVHATVAHVHAIDDGIPKRSAALDDPPAHDLHIVACQRACHRRHLDPKSRREYIQLER
jgi:hypothetical protein